MASHDKDFLAHAFAVCDRAWRADPWRRSRFHDMRGNRVALVDALRDIPRSAFWAGMREVTGYRPVVPWIPFPAIRLLESLAKPAWRVLEDGAGMSTLWWAKRVTQVVSIETNPVWAGKIRLEAARRGLTNVTVEDATPVSYPNLDRFPDASFDCLILDGPLRQEIAGQVGRIARRPGYVYLDNTDFAEAWPEKYCVAEERVLALGGGRLYLSGVTPTTLVASQGLLVDLS